MAAVENSEDISDLLGAEKPTVEKPTFETLALAAGYRAFPCKLDKKPRIKGWPSKATTDPAVLAAWSRQWPVSLVGVLTGEAQGLFVLDVDVKEGVDGFASLKALGITLPVTRTHRTRSGGLHYLFNFPKGENLTISAGKLAEGLDTRGNGGYVIWPGSPGYTVETDAPIADMPRDLLALLKQTKATATTTTAGAPAPRWKPESVAMALSPLVQRMIYRAFPPSAIEAAIRAEVPADCLGDALPLVPAEGAYQSPAIPKTTRDTVLTSMGGSMHAIGWSAGAILAALLVTDETQCQPPKGRQEVERITRSVTTYPRGFVAKPLKYDGGWITSDPSGVRYHKDGQEMRICGELRKLAMASDADDGQYAILVGWKSINGKQHRQAIPREALLGEGIEARRILTAGGLDIAPGKTAHAKLVAYLTMGHPRARALSVEKLGWHEGRFVLPEETIGEASDGAVIFQSDGKVTPALSVSGKVADWQASVARLAVGNSRLLFAISAALAGPLLDLAGEPGGGFHFRGGSSIGKTTALTAAASVWGKPRDFIRSWHATANGLEAVAALHNDGVMILDEIGEADPKTIGKTAYALSNGKGKSRGGMGRNLVARQALEWRLIYLSSGEESLRALAERDGGKVHAGQDIRLADIPADAGAGLGLFEQLHGLPSPGDLAKALGNPAHYGAVGMEWLSHLVAERERLTPGLRKGIDEIVALWASPEATGQVQRVARRFALVAMAGELATEARLTGWPVGAATWAAGQCFAAWEAGFTQGSDLPHEERALLDQVRLVLEKYGTSGFELVNPLEFSDPAEELGGAASEEGRVEEHHRVISRLGYRKRRDDGGFDYFVLTEAFRTVICKGYNPEEAAKTLLKHGWIKKPSGKGLSAKVGWGDRPRCYAFSSKVWE